MKDKIKFLLRKTNLFAEVPDSLLTQISENMQKLEAKAGTTIFRENDLGDAIYFVLDGTVSIQSEGIKIVTCKSGECFGEFALLDEEPRSASAIADTDVLLLSLNRREFQKALLQSREMDLSIFKILTGKLRQDVVRQVKMKQDLKRAHEVQMAMLPEGNLSTERIEVTGYCQPAADVGGDYYDYLLFEDDKLGIMIGDVTGHGFYSGLFVAMAKSCLHTQAQVDYSAEKVMKAMNHAVSISMDSGHLMLMSCCYILLDLQNRILTYSNAGHPYPYHYRRNTDTLGRLSSTDMLLGIPGFEESKFTTEERKWGKGDLLVLYSDGITEAENTEEEQFGDERLEKTILENREESTAYIKDCILDALSVHCEGMTQNDDVTLVVARAV